MGVKVGLKIFANFIMSNSCQIFNQRLEKIRKGIEELEGLKNEFLETGNQEIVKTFKEKEKEVLDLKQKYQDFAYPEYQKGQRLFLLEKEVLEELKEVIKKLEIRDDHVVSLDLSEKDLSSFFEKNPYFLKKFSQLKKVNLRDCNLKELSSKQFPEGIEEINAWGNKKIEINFKELKNLKRIDLSFCDLEKLSSQQLPEGIEEIDTRYNPEIEIDFKDLKNLKKVSLTSCNLNKLSSKQFPKGIEEINVANNPGIEIDFKDLKNLKKVNLTSCNLNKLSSKQFPEGIEEIDVRDNPGIKIDLELYDEQKFPNLTIKT